MNSKMLILGISVLAVGLFAMPTTVSLLEGQHTFINYTSGGQSCTNCHPNIAVSGGAHLALYKAGETDNNKQCFGCHVPGEVNSSIAIPANGTGVNLSAVSNTSAHVARVIKCTNCHDDAWTGLNSSSSDAHRPLAWNSTTGTYVFNATSNSTYIMPDDRACILCHTQGGVFDNLDALTNRTAFNVSVGRTVDNGSSTWSITYK